VDEWIEKAEKFVDKMFQLLNALEIRKREKILERTHEVLQKAIVTALKSLHGIEFPEEKEGIQVDFEEAKKRVEAKLSLPIEKAFERDFIQSKRVGEYYSDVWKKVEGMKKLADEKKITDIPDKDVYEMREYVRKLIHDLAKVLKEKETEEEK
jgi:hypothetical protein